jgi:hypothetical protein
MNEPSWLESVRESLAKKALPASYVRRILDELADHVEDLQEDAMGGELDIPGRLGKPEDVAAVALQRGNKTLEALSISSVTFAPMTLAQIKAYVASGEPSGKAGAYAVQGRAAVLITRISGSYSGVMGLPLHETSLLLRAAGFKV